MAPRHRGQGQGRSWDHALRPGRTNAGIWPAGCTLYARLGPEGHLQHRVHPPGPKFMVRKGRQTQNKMVATPRYAWDGGRCSTESQESSSLKTGHDVRL